MTGPGFSTQFSDLPASLPVFPLGGVLLLPYGRLPLNIFEERYLAMVDDALRSERLIGIIQPSNEADSQQKSPPLYKTGCAGRITAFSETDDGRYLVTLLGVCRFNIDQEIDSTRGYRRVVPNWGPFRSDITKPDSVTVFSFPMKSPSGAITRTEMSAIEQLELWKVYALYWCEHKPSVTISVKEHEWLEVGAWVYANFDYMSGVSFLPFSEHTYKQAPYQDCDEVQYEELLKSMPTNVDWTKLGEYENRDMTIGSQELACVAGGCEI